MTESEPEPLREGRVTQLKAQVKRPERVSLFIDGAFAFGIHQDLVVEFGLMKGMFLDVETQRRILDGNDRQVALAKALHFIGYRDRSESEVRRKLQQGGYGDPVADGVVERLKELGYIDDEAYAGRFAQARFESGGYGPQRIRYDLVRRGVERGLVDRVLAEYFETREDVMDSAREQAEKRWSRLTREADPKRRRKKVYDFLVRRGFTSDTARRAIEELARDRS